MGFRSISRLCILIARMIIPLPKILAGLNCWNICCSMSKMILCMARDVYAKIPLSSSIFNQKS
jgi:hypothetical protein